MHSNEKQERSMYKQKKKKEKKKKKIKKKKKKKKRKKKKKKGIYIVYTLFYELTTIQLYFKINF